MPVIPIIHDDRLSYDIYSRLLKDRMIWLTDEVETNNSTLICTQLLYLEAESDGENKPIHLYINSPGGSVCDGLAIYDIMMHIKSPVWTFCVGLAASMGSILLMAGEKGHRYAFENSEIMIHQPLGAIGMNQVSQIERRAENLINIKNKMNKIISKHTGQKLAKVEKDTDRDYFLSAEDSLKYGIIDQILKNT